ncbi:uncharacterized protein LOC129775866 isoform X3 [Toxorhynchites rutilus septentrionalis]|uniref:uncharacterized protein LOC129775866 isoform X3 n=1 Tax=Toxorhynchites rutilus septentrionalis TaxID=329112 RepID=UPI0024790E34|nr:uncharacterized protein LOC129775866 isoform X3 [Toxorhynchites rutilus septentrionalis]
MEQNIFDVSDDISFPWLPAYAEATDSCQLSTGSSRMLETIVEESSDDDDARGESKLSSMEHEQQQQQEQQQHPVGWAQFDQVWSSAGSDTGSVIRVDTPSDQDTMSERDFICPPKRRKQDSDNDGEEFIGGELTNGYSGNGRRARFCEPDGLEVTEYFMRRHNEPRLRFDEIGHDLFTDSDSLSYASLSRSSSLIQFESLERQLQQSESMVVASAQLSGSSPSLYTGDGAVGSAGGEHVLRTASVGCAADTQLGFYSPGKKSNLLTASNLLQQNNKLKAAAAVATCKQPVLNISDSELYSSSVSSTSSSGGSSGEGSSCNYASDECELNPHENTPSPSESQVARGCSDEAEGLSRCPQRCSERRRSLNQLRTKNSIESLSEDSGYCDHLHFNMNNLRVKSKSLTNFSSAENVNMFMEPVPMDFYDQRHVSFHQENRLATVCDEGEDEEDQRRDAGGQAVHHVEQCNSGGSVDNLSAQYERNNPEHWFAAKTNIHNCTKIELDTNKHSRTPCGEQRPFVVTTKLIPPSSSASSASSCSQLSSTDSLERHPTTTTATMTLDRHHRAEPKPKNSHRRHQQQQDDAEQIPFSRKRTRSQQQPHHRRTIISASSPDLFNGDQQQQRGAVVRVRNRKRIQRKVSDFLEYSGVNFAVSSVPECLNLCGGDGSLPTFGSHQSESLDSFELYESGTSSGNYSSWNQQQQLLLPSSVASKNFDLYDYAQEAEEEELLPTVVKSVKTVTFAKPRVNIRASYANLTALDYSDEDDGKQFYLNRNTFRTSSGTRLGKVQEMANPWDRKGGAFDEDEEEGKILQVESAEQNVFNSLLDEISAHFDRNLSIINDQAETYEPIAAFLHEHRSAPQTPQSFAALVATAPQTPPRRTQIKTNPHHHTQGPTVREPEGGASKRRTFDQDPTNLVTCYAASLERCTFDPSESTLNLHNNKSSELSMHHPTPAAAAARYAPMVVAKREFVSSTPNLNYYHGNGDNGDGDGEGGLNAHHNNSLKNVSCLEIGGGEFAACRSTGILTNASSSKCGLSKGVSFCPIVSEIIWKDNGSELDGEDNASIVSNQDFEIDIDEDDFDQDDYDHANLIATQTNTLINANSVETGLCELVGNYQHHHHQEDQRVPTPVVVCDRFELGNGDVIEFLSPERAAAEEDRRLGEERVKERDDRMIASINNARQAAKLTESDVSTTVITAEEGSMMASAIANGVDASKNMIAAESAAAAVSESVPPAQQEEETQRAPTPVPALQQQKFTNNNNNLIKNFKNGKAEKKGKTFLSRLSSGFRFSFRGKSKKNKDGVSGSSNGKAAAGAAPLPSARSDKQSSPGKVKESSAGHDKVSSDFIYIPLKDPVGHQQQSHRPVHSNRINNSADEVASEVVPDNDEEYYLRQMNTIGLQNNTNNGSDETDRVYDPNESFTTFQSDSTALLNSSATSSTAGASIGALQNHVLSGKPPLPKQPPRVVGVCAKRSTPSQRLAHAYQQQRASSTPPRTEIDLDESSSGGSCHRQYINDADRANGAEGFAGSGLSPSLSAVVGRYSSGRHSQQAHHQQQQQLISDSENYFNHIMGSEQKIGLIETNLDTHETIISGKTRSLMELGGPSQMHHHQLQVHHGGGVGGDSKRLLGGGGGVNGIKDRQTAAVANEPGRPHKSMEFLLDKENQRNVLPPENELQKSHETGTNLSEHQLRVQASLQRLNIPDWYKQYCGKDGPHTAVLQNNTNINISNSGVAPGAGGGVLRKRNSDVGRWTGLSSKTTSLSSLGSHRSDRSPVMLSPSAHSHHGGQTGFSRWSTSHLNSNQTSPSVSTRGSFTRGGLNASVVSGYSTASTTAGSMAGGNSAIRNSFRQPYLGWRSQEKLSQPRTPAERLASSLLSQQKAKEQQHHQNQQKAEPVVTPEIQSSIKEVTSAIVHYVNDQTNRHSRSRSTSPSQRCWLESSFVGTRPLDSPQTPMMIDNSSSSSTTVVLAGQQQHPAAHQTSNMMAGDHYRQNAGRMNGVVDLANSSCLTPTASSNHTLQIEPAQIRRRSEGDAGRRRNDSGGSGAISSSAASSGKENHSRRVSLDSCDTTHKSHGEPLKCRYPKCDATATIAEAKKSYKSCHNCSHLYCSRECRRAHWEKHRKACLHSRISALCRLVLSTCKDDADTLRHLSRLARRGYLSQGRGVVRILFRSPENADSFIKQGFQCLGEVSYVRWPDLLPSEMGPELYSELLKLSTEYKPDSKMLTYVAICVVSEAPGNATAPVKWERQLVSRCAKLKLCKSVINEISNSPIERQFPKKENATDVLILSFNILSKTTQKSREAVSQNIQNILRQRGVVLRKHYPEVFQRLCTFVEGSTDRYLPVTVHPRDSVTGRPFVCIIMPNYGDSDKVQFPISENCDDERVMTIDVGADVVDIRVEPAVDTDVNQ